MVNTSIILANPDFASIRGSLSAFLKSQSQFQDYDFDGSNLSVILDILAYNTYQDAFLSNMVASEMFLDSAQLLSSVVSHAKELGYIPRSSRSSHAIIDVQINPNDAPGLIIIPAGTPFNAAFGSQSFTFITRTPYVIIPVNGVYQASNVDVYEGFQTSDFFTMNSNDPNQLFILSNQQIDTNSLTVAAGATVYTNAVSLVDITTTSNVYFLQKTPTGNYQILFGDNIVGAQPADQSIIQATYLATNADSPNGASIFTSAGSIAGYSSITVVTVNAAAGGAQPETIDSIRLNAPQVYQTRNRAVIADDYKVLLKQQFPEIQAINVYGGENVSPPQYGKVFISINVSDSSGVSNTRISEYTTYIASRSPLTIQPVFIPPVFVYLRLTITAYWDYINFAASDQQIQSSVITALESFNNDVLNNFDVTLPFSHLMTTIDNSNPAIISNETALTMMLNLNVSLLPTQSQTVSFNIPLDTSKPPITSSSFKYGGQICSITDDGTGNLNIVTTQQLITTIVQSIGSVDYASGTITITPFTPQQIFGSGIMIFAKPQINTISATNNIIMNIDFSQITINTVATEPNG